MTKATERELVHAWEVTKVLKDMDAGGFAMTGDTRRRSGTGRVVTLFGGSLLVILAVGLVLAGCGSATTTTTAPAVSTTLVPENVGGLNAAAVVVVKNDRLSVTGLIHVGDLVAFLNGEDDSTKQHRLVADDGTFDTGVLNAGAVYSHVFGKAGTVAFHDELNPSIKGTLTVLP